MQVLDTKVEEFPTVEVVNNHILQRYDELVQNANAESMPALLDSWAKYMASLRNNNTLGQEETAEEKQQREVAKILEGEING